MKLSKIMHRGGVANTAELQRILAMPSYRWQDDPNIESLGRYLESLYAIGTQHLRPVQVAALQAIHDYGGLFGPIRVGGGKTLISLLAGTVTGAKRTLIIIPAKLQKKTVRDFAILKRHWRAPKRYHIMSYELLSRDRGVAELQAFYPDLIVSDESHKFKNPNAACTKRVHRYLTKERPEAGYIDMSGTTTKRSIMEYHHRINWALQDGAQPIPRNALEARDWADAIDEKTSGSGRLMPGALVGLYNDAEIKTAAKNPSKRATIKTTREAYCRRLMSAPGVVGTEEQFDGAMSIVLQGHEFVPGPSVIEAFRTLREEWCLPDGHPIDMPATLWRHARELIQGFYYKWDPLPPKEWIWARKTWAGVCREILKNYRDIDSPLMAARAVESGRIDWGRGALEDWRRIKGTFIPKSKAYWIDDTCLKWVADWGSKNRGIIWVNEVAFGKRLSEETGIPYYGAKGLCGKKMIEDEKGICIASIQANSEGRNLQHFSNNLIVSTPPGGAVWEQMLGRTHRDGQEADEISVDVPLCCYEQWDVFRKAKRDAEYIESTTSQCQKLNFADITIVEEAEIQKRHLAGDPLWDKKNAEFFADEGAYTKREMEISSMSMKQRARIRRGIT